MKLWTSTDGWWSRWRRRGRSGSRAAEQVALAAAGPHRAASADPRLLDYEACYARCDDVYAAVSLLADNAAQVPLRVLRDGAPRPDSELALLLERINPHQGAVEFWTRVYSLLWLTGEAYLLIERNNPYDAELPNELWAVAGRVIEPVCGDGEYLSGYRFRPPGAGTGFELPRADVVPLLLFHPSKPLRGLSPLSSLRLALAAELHAKQANCDLFANGLMTDVAINFEFANDEQRQRTREALRSAHSRDGRRHGILMLEHTTRVEPLSLSPRDAEFLELDRLTTRDVAKAYRIPPMFLAQLDHATLRNFETGYRALWELAILPRVRQVAAALTEHLAPQFGAGLTVEADLSGIECLRAGDRDRAATLAGLTGAGLDADWAARRVFGAEAPAAAGEPA